MNQPKISSGHAHTQTTGSPNEYLALVDDDDPLAVSAEASGGLTTHPYENMTLKEHSPSQSTHGTDIRSEYMKTYRVDTSNVTSEYMKTYQVDTDNVTSEYLTTLAEDQGDGPPANEPENIGTSGPGNDSEDE